MIGQLAGAVGANMIANGLANGLTAQPTAPAVAPIDYSLSAEVKQPPAVIMPLFVPAAAGAFIGPDGSKTPKQQPTTQAAGGCASCAAAEASYQAPASIVLWVAVGALAGWASGRGVAMGAVVGALAGMASKSWGAQ